MPLQLLAIAADPSFAEAVAREVALLRAELRVQTRAGGVHAAARAVREEGPQLLALALPVVGPGDLQELGEALASRPGTAVLLLPAWAAATTSGWFATRNPRPPIRRGITCRR